MGETTVRHVHQLEDERASNASCRVQLAKGVQSRERRVQIVGRVPDVRVVTGWAHPGVSWLCGVRKARSGSVRECNRARYRVNFSAIKSTTKSLRNRELNK